MTKVSITGHKKHLQTTIDKLYDLGLLDIEEYDGDLETGSPFEGAEELSEILVEVRSLLSKLPDVEYDEQNTFQLSGFEQELEEMKQDIETKEAEITELERSVSQVNDKRKFYTRLRGTDLTTEDLNGTDTLNVYLGRFDREEFVAEIETDKYEIFEGEGAKAVLYSRKVEGDIQDALRKANSRELRFHSTDFEGTPEEVVEKLKQSKKELRKEKEATEQEYREMARKAGGKLKAADDFLTEKVEKAEAPLDFATTGRTFIAEGWIPEEKFEELGNRIHTATNGKVHIQTEPTEETPPTKYENNRAVAPFESLTELVNTPKYNELDPSIVLMLTFPLFFGFMIGDAGYGITSAIVFYAAAKKFPGAKDIFNSLIYASVATFLFGLAFGDAFGYVIFGHHSELAAVTGIHLFEQIPILFHRVEHLGQVFNWAALIGFVHINLGILIGFYNDFMQHGLKEAFLEDISWFVLEIGALAWYAFGATVGAPVLLIGLVMLGVGEGVEGIVEIPSLIANMLSYLRLFGVAVAAISLAAVVNAMAEPLFQMGGPLGFGLGLLLLIFGHTFNTFLKIMEGFLQGIRLHYVEMFTKFFEGGGRKYMPFGAKNP